MVYHSCHLTLTMSYQCYLYDIMMISRAFATKILHLFALECSNPAFGGNIATSQKFVRGNVAVLPQDSVNLQFVLPPTRSVIADAMCALFVRWKTKPTRENIASLRPVLVSKRRARTLIDFLVNHNVWYKIAGLTFLEENLSDLYPEDENDVDESVPTAVEICHLDGSHGLAAATSDYADRRTFHAADPQPELHEMVMDIVGYASGDYTPQNHKMMKAEALARVLDGSQFLKMQAGSNFINERDPDQRIPFERQVKNLLKQHDSPFQKDPRFAYVCWNIIQKRGHPSAKSSNRQQKRALKMLNRLKFVAKELKGSFGYKLCRRNKICALMKRFCTLALSVTLNPADIWNPLIAIIVGLTSSEWLQMSAFERAVFVANNPAPAALFFDSMIQSFLNIIVRYNRGVGLSLWDMYRALRYGGSARAGDSTLSYAFVAERKLLNCSQLSATGTNILTLGA
ncbi:hypothetical protein SERLADRAFT_418747 [Serpula lacrymans var. lacrymans S7.9]|uniref:Uncharacterized protein n=1 Tax=Serpula lacrymans var. lacrymans (strain S7.9) TaxID=578457 RepID=F8PDN0_SERL9|nr:uncharacterized protein SERLADRAFT_418747 [Serpula lacrymans var. lacrymans S7.9]EGO18851.1 hypothetical protein SERLADRAFT_418747 [Serpula lacrymans var. lacrymans S7.9]